MTDWKLYAFGAAFFAGLTALLSKMGVKDIPSNLATLIRTAVILFLLSLIVMIRQEWQNPLALSRKSLIFLILSGAATGLSWLCYFRALQTGPISGVASLDKMSLAVAVVLSMLFLGERLEGFQWAGVVLIMAGAALIVK